MFSWWYSAVCSTRVHKETKKQAKQASKLEEGEGQSYLECQNPLVIQEVGWWFGMSVVGGWVSAPPGVARAVGRAGRRVGQHATGGAGWRRHKDRDRLPRPGAILLPAGRLTSRPASCGGALLPPLSLLLQKSYHNGDVVAVAATVPHGPLLLGGLHQGVRSILGCRGGGGNRGGAGQGEG